MKQKIMCWFIFFLMAFAMVKAESEATFITIPEQEKQLYLSPGGKYTQEDIVANASATRSQKFIHFIAAHDPHPKKGDYRCPITSTKANENCTWIVGGKTYRFCCPPCIDEFLLLAKTHPEEIKDPEDYLLK